jgi:C-terminal processing protease CtpA/Prc
MVHIELYLERGTRRYWFLFTFLLLGLCTAGFNPNQPLGTENKPVPQVAAHAILSPEKMREDLEHMVRILKRVHPATYHGFTNLQQAVIDEAYQKIQTPMPAKRFYFIVNSVTCSLEDGHTHLHPMENKQNRRIDASIIWLPDAFYVRDEREPFQQGDRIIAIGGKSIESIYRQMRVMIPAENENYRKWSMAEKIQREEFLEYLEVTENNAVEISVERAGNRITLIAPLKPAAQCVHPQPSRPWVGYQVDADLSLAVFYLDKCDPNEQYTKTVGAFFKEVNEKQIRNIAIDVRRNGGGNSRVIDEFFRYLNIDRFKSFSCDIRYSEEVAQWAGYSETSGYRHGEPCEIQNHRVQDSNLLFDGKLYVLTSPETFSSGNWFAVIVKDNGLGTIIGEPTGNAPSSYGDAPSFQMPNSGFCFCVSHKKFVRPNPDNDPEDGLYPDILVNRSINDIIAGVDTQLEKLKAIITTETKN